MFHYQLLILLLSLPAYESFNQVIYLPPLFFIGVDYFRLLKWLFYSSNAQFLIPIPYKCFVLISFKGNLITDYLVKNFKVFDL